MNPLVPVRPDNIFFRGVVSQAYRKCAGGRSKFESIARGRLNSRPLLSTGVERYFVLLGRYPDGQPEAAGFPPDVEVPYVSVYLP